MKKKFIVGTLLAASLLGCGTFTSCKDDCQDLRTEMTQEYTSLKATLEKLQAELDLFKTECPQKCQEKIDALTKLMNEKNAELEGKIADLNNALGGKADKGTVDKLQSDVDNLQKELGKLAGQVASLETLKSNFESFQTTVNGQISGILAAIEDLKKGQCQCDLTEILQDILTLKTNVATLFTNFDGLQGQIDGINDTLAGIPGQIAGVKDDLTKEINDKIEALRKEFGDQLTTINNQLSGLGGQISDLNGQVSTINNRVDILNSDVAKILLEIADLGTIRETLNNLVETVKTISELENRIAAVEKTVQQHGNDISIIKGDISTMQGSLSGLAKDILDINTLITGIQGEIGGIKGDITGIKGDVANLQGDVATINTQITTLQNGLAGLEKWFQGIGLTVEQFQEYVKQGEFVKVNKDALQSLVNLINDGTINGEALKALNEVYQNLSGINDMYTSIFEGAQAPEEGWWKYDQVIRAIKDNSAAIETLKNDQEKVLNRFNDMVTSLILQAATNPVFGAINTPFGVNSMVLMALYGNLTTNVEQFPVSGVGAECNGFDDIDWSVVTDPYKLASTVLVDTNEKGEAKLGDFWFTVNPGTVNTLDKDGFALVNSVEETNGVKLTNITKDDETVLTFGVSSRAAGNGNGLYKADVTIAPDELYKIKVNIQDGLAQTLKDAAKNHTGADMMTMMRALYQQLHNVCQANALRYTYDAYTSKNADGTWNKTAQKVYSNYGVAATAFKPLSFATLKGTSIDRRVPTFSPIKINKDQVNLNLGNFDINSKNFNLNLKFGEPEFDSLGHLTVTTHVVLKDKDGQDVEGDVTIDITKQAQEIQDNVKDAMHKWLNEGGTLDERIDKAVWQALFNGTSDKDPKYAYDPSLPKGVIVDLQEQVQDMTGKIQDKLNNVIDKINKDYLSKVNSLIAKYNQVADLINNFLKEPNHYLQATMLYSRQGSVYIDGSSLPALDLPFGLLSTNPKQPTQFRGDGEAIELWATTYNFEVLCPAFKKVVAVTKVTDAQGKERNDLKTAANKNLCQILPGNRTRVALDVAGAKNGVFTYEIAYQALDYSGFTSTVKCYIQVVR